MPSPIVTEYQTTLQVLGTGTASRINVNQQAFQVLYNYTPSDPIVFQIVFQALVNYGQPGKPAKPTFTVAPTIISVTVGSLTQYAEWLDLEIAPEVAEGYPGEFTLLASHITPGSTFADFHAESGFFYYRVGARNIVNVTYSDISNRAHNTGLTSVDYIFKNGGCGGTGYLYWSLASLPTGFEGYNVYVSAQSGGPYTRVNGSLITGNAATVTGLDMNIPKYYIVRVVVTDGESRNSEEVEFRALALPVTPYHLTAKPGADHITLDWG